MTINTNKLLLYFQLLDTLPVCQDFNRQGCTRPTCRFVHVREGVFQILLFLNQVINKMNALTSQLRSQAWGDN